jgi:hypothetical protein
LRGALSDRFDDATFLSRVITGDKGWIYGYEPETKQQSSQWKMKSKIKSMLIIFFDNKEIVHKQLILAGQTVNSAYCRGIFMVTA